MYCKSEILSSAIFVQIHTTRIAFVLCLCMETPNAPHADGCKSERKTPTGEDEEFSLGKFSVSEVHLTKQHEVSFVFQVRVHGRYSDRPTETSFPDKAPGAFWPAKTCQCPTLDFSLLKKTCNCALSVAFVSVAMAKQ